ncbi:MAG: PorT family protein [Candidatus Azobacteroides sp.]|nr:PorT family protein [Candidatus Azobacteroides sp.]
MKDYWPVIALFFVGISVFAQDSNKRIDWGLKGGFNSGICLINDFSMDGKEIKHPENIYKVGLTGSLFMRVNLNKMYLQTEAGYYYTRGSLEFNFTDESENNNTVDLSWEFNSMGIPVLFGYHIIKVPPYGFNLYAGPKISKIIVAKKVFNVDHNTYPLNYDFKPHYPSLVCGFGVSISKLFFDFRYEFGLKNYLNGITYTSSSGSENPFGEMIMKGRMNAMSFSGGFIF